MHYLDNAATTAVYPEAAAAAMRAMTEAFGNPSSVHRMGREAAAMVADARSNVASALGCEPSEVFFTSSGTEANNWAILRGAAAMKRRGNRIIVSAAEHSSVLEPARELAALGFDVVFLPPAKNGALDKETFGNALNDGTILVSLMLVNNETGAVSDISAAARMIRESGAPAMLHCDAVQGFLKVGFKPQTIGADFVTVSAHKIGGCKGAGALYIKKSRRLTPLIHGGGQENRLRSGTEAVPAIAAFGEAAKIGLQRFAANTAKMRGVLEYARTALSAVTPAYAPVAEPEAPHILCVSVAGMAGEVLVRYLGDRGVFVSTGAACSKKRSHVLESMGVPVKMIDSAIRISLSPESETDDIDALIVALKSAVQDLAHIR